MIDFGNSAAQVERHGREYEARVRFCIPAEATDEQVEEFIAYELGRGSCSSDNPLLDGPGVSRLSVIDLAQTGWELFTDWEAQEPGGERYGRGRRERVPLLSASGVPLTRRRM